MKIEKEIIEILIYGFLFVGLLIETIEDIREKKIWLPVMLLEIPTLLVLNYWIGNGSIMLWLASFGVGAFFYLMSVITREQLGKGDASLFCMTGAGLGMADNILVIYVTFFLAFLVAAFLWKVKRVSKNYAMPLAPFLLCAYLLVAGYRLLQ